MEKKIYHTVKLRYTVLVCSLIFTSQTYFQKKMVAIWRQNEVLPVYLQQQK